MTDIVNLHAEVRERAGKGAARAVRRAGRVPGVVYGGKKAPLLVSVDPRDIRRGLDAGIFFSTVYNLDVGNDVERVIPRDVAMHPVKTMPQHVDFMRVSADTRITVEVPVHFLNEEECPGLKRGGVINVVRYHVEVHCGIDNIPQGFDLDLTGLDIGDSIHASKLALPQGVTLTITDRDFTIATIAAPTVVSEEDTAAAAPAAAEGAEAPAEGEEPAEGAEGEKKDE
ncbi:MAG: 50S ribosomal protein L25/general stress protein Ctc [Burkholderiales bacterium]